MLTKSNEKDRCCIIHLISKGNGVRRVTNEHSQETEAFNWLQTPLVPVMLVSLQKEQVQHPPLSLPCRFPGFGSRSHPGIYLDGCRVDGGDCLQSRSAAEMFNVLLAETMFPQAPASPAVPIALPSLEGKPKAGERCQQVSHVTEAVCTLGGLFSGLN